MKNLRSLFSCLAIVLLLASAGFSQDDKKNEPELLIKAAKFLEDKPFDKDAKKIRSWAVTWVIETDKVSVVICPLIVTGIDKKYKYGSEMTAQYTIGMAAFKLSNPDQAKDEDAAQQAGWESVLKAYESMVKEQPKAKNAFLDGLLDKRAKGELAQYLKENNCKNKE
jgi:hypothetical protein